MKIVHAAVVSTATWFGLLIGVVVGTVFGTLMSMSTLFIAAVNPEAFESMHRIVSRARERGGEDEKHT